MRNATAKFLRKNSYLLAAQWLKEMIPEDQRASVTTESVKAFEKEQDKHIYANNRIILSAYNSRWFYKKLKKSVKTGIRPDFTLKNVSELGG